MSKRALLVGCTYQGSKYALRGCVNDTQAMRAMLIEHYGFPPENIVMLVDQGESHGTPTGGAIKRKLAELVAASQPGDTLVLHYSGHGTQIPSDRPEEDDRFDECICPIDMNVITDDDLRAILKDLDDGVHFTMVADCCHSGTLLDHDEVQITGPKAGDPAPPPSLLEAFLLLAGKDASEREAVPRFIPPEDYVKLLGEKLGVDIPVGQIRASLSQLFGEDATKKVEGIISQVGDAVQVAAAKVKEAAAQPDGAQAKGLMGDLGSMFGAIALQVAETAITAAAEAQGSAPPAPGTVQLPFAGVKPPPDQRLPPGKGLLISGCMASETSADACPAGQPDKAFGALTNALVTTVKQFKAAHPDADISYRTLVHSIREALTHARFPQNPCLESSADNADRAAFI